MRTRQVAVLLEVHADRDHAVLVARRVAGGHRTHRLDQPGAHVRAQHRAPVVGHHQDRRLTRHALPERDRLVVLVPERQVERHLVADLLLDLDLVALLRDVRLWCHPAPPHLREGWRRGDRDREEQE